MKKVLAIIAVAGLLTACNNNAGSEKKTDEPTKITVPPGDTSNMMNDPSHNMMPHDTGEMERRPHQ
jgi:hypothetical protein